jgi:phosphatidylglycerophosphate synthase
MDMAGPGKAEGFYGMATLLPGALAALRASGQRALAVAALALLALGAALQQGLGLDGAVLAKAVGAFALGATLVLRALPAHAPHARFGAANAMTLARATLTALLAGLLGAGDAPAVAYAALALAIPALVTDGLDGWLARRAGTSSAFGARFDMETDAVLILVLCALAWQLGKAGPWILAAGLMRYAFVAAARVLPWMRRELPPSRRRQTACVVQLVALLVMLAPFVPTAASVAIGTASLALLAGSFAADVMWLAREKP